MVPILVRLKKEQIMKNVFIVSLGLITLVSCTSQKKGNSDIQSIGGKKDKHGCLVAAGQSWSQVRENCIQVFNDGIRLDPVSVKENEATFSAFIVYPKDNRSRAELFLPNQEETVILHTKDELVYNNGKYAYNPKTGILLINGVKKFQTVR